MMTQRLLTLSLLLACGFPLFISAQESKSKPAPVKKVKVHPKFAAGLHTEGAVIFTYVDEKHRRRLTLDLYRPEEKVDPLPAIVMFFGGGWQNGRPGLFAALAQRLAQRGYVCIVPEYRLSGEAPFPAAVHDAKAAIRWTRANAKRFGIDPNRIACLGGSAGGHLAGFMAASNGIDRFEGQGDWQESASTVQAAVVFAGPMNLLDPNVVDRVENAGPNGNAIIDFMGGYKPSNNEAIYREASPLTHIGKHLPPMLFIDGEKDRPRVRYTEFRKRMDELGIPNEFALMPGGPHPFWVYEAWFEPTVDVVDNFLKKQLP